jgi:hypothetical protein
MVSVRIKLVQSIIELIGLIWSYFLGLFNEWKIPIP